MWGNTSIFCIAAMIRSRRDRGEADRVIRSLALFVLAGLCEIGGGYLVWQWWRQGAPPLVGALGAAVSVLYGLGLGRRPQRARPLRSAGRRDLPGRGRRRHVLAAVGRTQKILRRAGLG